MVKSKCILAVTLLSLAASSLAAAVEQPISPAEVPHAVAQAVSDRYPAAQGVQFAREIAHGQAVYAVKLAVAGARTELCVARSGGIESEQQAITAATLPTAVQDSLVASGFHPSEVVAARRTIRFGQSAPATYEILVDFQGAQHKVMFDGTGQLVTAPPPSGCIGEPGPTSNRVARSAPHASAPRASQIPA
jgi:hypothetical protein